MAHRKATFLKHMQLSKLTLLMFSNESPIGVVVNTQAYNKSYIDMNIDTLKSVWGEIEKPM